MKDLNEIKHEIANHLQVILWALQPESEGKCMREAKEAVRGIVEALEGINGEGKDRCINDKCAYHCLSEDNGCTAYNTLTICASLIRGKKTV
jgi:hypothetical protein